MDEGTERGLVWVAPREIVDYATRALRVAQVDPGTADAVARDTADRQLIDSSAVAELVAAIEHGDLASAIERALGLTDEGPTAPVDADIRRRAARFGTEVRTDDWSALRHTASSFLVSESVLDDAEA